jgi:hypothetical protein
MHASFLTEWQNLMHGLLIQQKQLRNLPWHCHVCRFPCICTHTALWPDQQYHQSCETHGDVYVKLTSAIVCSQHLLFRVCFVSYAHQSRISITTELHLCATSIFSRMRDCKHGQIEVPTRPPTKVRSEDHDCGLVARVVAGPAVWDVVHRLVADSS